MNRTKVFTNEGTGRPRRCASQTPSGSIDAATSDAASILRGVDGAIIAAMRMMIGVHDRCSSVCVVGAVTQVVSIAMKIAFRTRYQSPASDFFWQVCGA